MCTQNRRVGLLAMPLLSTALMVMGASDALAAADSEKLNLRNELGIVQAKGGHLEDALRQFSLVLAEAPVQPAALNNAANVYFLQGDITHARELYERALTAAPKEGGIHLNLGVLLHTVGEEESSLAHVRQGLMLVGDLQHAYFLLGISAHESQQDSQSDSAATGASQKAAASLKPAGDQQRASDEAGLREVEIEALLARAMQKVPKADSTSTRSAATTSDRMETRPAGSKAAQIGSGPQRLYWMQLDAKP